MEQYRESARNALRGKWALAVLTGFIASLLGAYTTVTNASVSVDIDAVIELIGGHFTADLFTALLMLAVFTLLAYIVSALIKLIISGPISLGYVKFNLNLIDDNNPQFEDLFSQFKCWKAGFVLQLLRSTFTMLWTLLFVIPGIVATYAYAMAPYILYENPGMSASEAIKESKRLMDGKKWDLFCLDLSFLGWSILCVLTLGIGFLWLQPYTQASYAAFYNDIKWKNGYSYETGYSSEDSPYGSF